MKHVNKKKVHFILELLTFFAKTLEIKFQQTFLNISLANCHPAKENSLITIVTVETEIRKFCTDFIVLPKAKGNRTFLGRDFLDRSGLVPDVKNRHFLLQVTYLV